MDNMNDFEIENGTLKGYIGEGGAVIIPDGVISIGDGAFYDCKKLASVIIPDSVTSVGEDTFRDWKSLTSITIPDSVTSIGKSAFQGRESLTCINPDGVTYLEKASKDFHI